MRLHFAAVLLALGLLPSVTMAQEVITVPLLDKSDTESPFEVNGSIRLEETVRGDDLEWSWAQKITIKNISDRPILLFVAALTEIGRYPRGPRSAPGDGPSYEFDDDRFFKDDLFLPGQSLTLRDSEPNNRQTACCISSLPQKSNPSAEYKTCFVQFADGSTFGKDTDARDALTMRQMIVDALTELLKAYAQLGAPGFATKLSENSSFSSTAIGKQIVAKYHEGGVQPALVSAQRILATAQRHAAMISGAAAASQSGPRN